MTDNYRKNLKEHGWKAGLWNDPYTKKYNFEDESEKKRKKLNKSK